MEDLHNITDKKTGKKMPMLGDYHSKIIKENADKLNSAIIYDRDFSYNYFGFKVSPALVQMIQPFTWNVQIFNNLCRYSWTFGI